MSNIVSYSILLLYLLPCASWSQGNDVDLSLEQSLDLLHKENKSLKIAGKEVEWARASKAKRFLVSVGERRGCFRTYVESDRGTAVAE